MASLLDRLIESSTIKETDSLGDSVLFADTFSAPTQVPMLNVALGGSLGGGVTYGITQFAGPSKHFKTLFGMICVKAYLDKFKDAIVLFYDAEFGAGWQYFDNLKIDRKRVIHTPVTNIEDLKHDIVVQLKNIQRDDHVIIFVDSIGNLASMKEANDAEEGKQVTDMTRAKALKSLFRIITPQLALKDIPLIAINHTYKTLEMYSKDVVGGGCVVAGTEITMFDGTKKLVENISQGELVQTLDGAKVVTETWNPNSLEDGEPECYEITFADGSTITCSDKHAFMVNGNWTEAQKLMIGDDVKTV